MEEELGFSGDLFIEDNLNEDEMKAQSEDLLELRHITKDNAVFKRTKGGFVSLEYAQKKYERVLVYRTFPMSEPENYISIREADEKAREIGMIEHLSELDEDTQDMLREQLKLRYFKPQIIKINDVKDEYGFAYFNVQTDFGPCRFTIQMGGDSVVSLTDTRIIITDLDGNKFEIPDLDKLSTSERKKLDLFI